MYKKLQTLIAIMLLGCLTVTTGCHFIPVATSTPAGAQVLNLYGIDPITLDPAIAGEMTSHGYITQIYSGLVRLDENLEPAPDIAERWEISQDGKTYTFYLHQDAYFHNGQRVTAADFKWSWERACAPVTASSTAATYLGDIVGVNAVIDGASDKIDGVTVVDDYTLRVEVDQPKAYFLSKLTYPVAYVLDRENVADGEDWWHHPNGTGPFVLREWEENNLLVLERNELYHGRQAILDYITYNLWAGVPMNMYETGEIDVTGVSFDYIDKVNDPAGKFYGQLQIVPELSFEYIGFNSAREPFDDPNVRRAFSMAVDKDKLVSLVFRDMVSKADGILPPGIPGFNENISGLEFDVARAKQMIANSRYGDVSNLPPITITTSGWGGLISDSLTAIIQEWQQNLGVEVQVRQLEPEHFLYNIKEEKDQMFYMGWIADYPHPQNFLDVLFHTGRDNNSSEYSNQAVDALLDLAAVETDKDLSLNIYQQAEQLMIDDACCLPLWFGKNYVMVKPYVKGYRLTPMGIPMLNEVYMERED